MFIVSFCHGTCCFLLRHFNQFPIILLKLAVTVFTSLLFENCHRIYLIFLVIFFKCVYDRKKTAAHQYVLAAVYVSN